MKSERMGRGIRGGPKADLGWCGPVLQAEANREDKGPIEARTGSQLLGKQDTGDPHQ